MARHYFENWFAMVRGLGMIALVSTCVQAQTPKETYLKRLDEREAKIRDMSGQYETRSVASDLYAKRQVESGKKQATEELAKNRNPRKPPDTLEEAIERSRAISVYTFMLRNDGGLRERRLDREVHKSDPALPFMSGRIAFNGRNSYEVRDPLVTVKNHHATVNVDKVDVKMLFDMDCDMAILMGLCLPRCDGTLSALARRHDAEFSEPIVKDGMHLVELRFALPSSGTGTISAIRVTALLDLDHDLAIRELNHAMIPIRILAKNPDPKTAPGFMRHWEVSELAQEPSTRIWYPHKSRSGAMSSNWEYTIEIRDTTYEPPAFNQRLSSSDFTPRLLAGSLIFDNLHRGSRRYPGTIPDQIVATVKNTAETAQRTMANAATPSTSPRPAMPGEHLFRGMITGIVAVLLLVTAAIWRRRSKSEKA